MKLIRYDEPSEDESLSLEFSKFYRVQFIKLKTSLLFMGIEEDLAIDLAQECFTKLWLRWRDFDSNISRISFLKISSRNLWLDKCRKFKNEKLYLAHISRNTELSYDQLHYKELMHAIQQALSTYEDRYHHIFMSIKVHGKSYKDAATEFQINIKTLERHMTKMSKIVKDYLIKHHFHIPFIIFPIYF